MQEADRPLTRADILGLEMTFKSDFANLEKNLKSMFADEVGNLRNDIKRLDQTDKRLAKAIVDLQEGMRSIEERMFTKAQGNRVFELLDELRGLHKHDNRAVMIHGQQLTEIEDRLKDHEERIDKLEHPRPS